MITEIVGEELAVCFSALQRAENSSICEHPLDRRLRAVEFQCSSASRKFLNLLETLLSSAVTTPGFSALQRAENSSIVGGVRRIPRR